MAWKWFRRRTGIILGLAAILLAAAAFGISHLIEGSQTGLLSGIRDSCISSAMETVRARGLDVAKPDIAQKLESYCSCVVDAVKSGKMSPAELTLFSADPQSADPAVAKVREMVAVCLR